MSASTTIDTYTTTDLKLAALILCQVEGARFKVISRPGASWKHIEISHLPDQESKIQELIRAYIERTAKVSLYQYNRILNALRDGVKGKS